MRERSVAAALAPSRQDGDVHTVEHRGPAGDPFPVTFATQADAEVPWHLDREHVPQAMTPLAAAVHAAGRVGRERAYAESGVAMPDVVRRVHPDANGYGYAPAFELTPHERRTFAADIDRLVRAHGSSQAVWDEHSSPAVRRGCEALASAGDETPFSVLAEWRDYVWGHTSVAGAVSRVDERAVIRLLRPPYGDEAEAVALALAQGGSNETLCADAALWELARLEPGTPPAQSARRAFLAEHGGRSVSWTIDHPTLQERPDLLDAEVRLLRRTAPRSPAAVHAEAAARRDALLGEVARLALAPADRAALDHHLEGLRSFVAVREARARAQLIASGSMRAAVRRRGRALVEAGVLVAVDDVFLLVPAEYDDPALVPPDVVEARRADLAHWRAVTPPAQIGRPRGDRGSAWATAPVAGPGPDAEADLVRGVAASAGVASGRARVVRELIDAERLAPGDVLVTTMTAPPWTPLFGVVAAVVTDSGDAISHAAIAAREYGIPCVVATGTGTQRIPDGQPVIVDGDRGVVVLGPPDAAPTER